ncbi:TetR/AcrR family transcriptional regulator [Maricaulis sp.]|jgi:AcrR family transcriptional regulator|uniref:TetR/AcrR family transcriptional regulator n=1 Tax=Maricaulis sp. TaxID=1486257 RepID=UPI00262559FE|nr:TetR/AcrR family transcriptional regulator [Maricaulis sp.]
MNATPKAMDSAKTRRFQQKREMILDAAATLINRHGVRGMTFVDVAQLVDLNTTSITYYFKRKELLAAAVLERSLERIEALIEEAGRGRTPQERIERYIRLTFDLQASINSDDERPIAVLSDIRALNEPYNSDLTARYVQVFRKLRTFFDAPRNEDEKVLGTIRAHVLVQNMFWLPAWITQYSAGDYPRVCGRMIELFETGFAPKGAAWTPKLLPIDESSLKVGIEGMPGNFARAATFLINERGYRGASVEQIASELNVTKGSFYHHLEAKDELVLECFRRAYGRVSLVQRAATKAGGNQWQQVCSSIATLLNVQLYSEFPLLRTTALQALPTELRDDVIERSNRMARRFAGMMIDGITEGSIKAIDPLIASQALMGALNSAYDLRNWIQRVPPEKAFAFYGSTLAYGLFADPPRPYLG